MEETYRWIKCKYVSQNGEFDVVLRQSEPFSEVFLDEKGNKYGISDLDFTQVQEEPSFMNDWNEHMRKSEEEHERTQNQLRDMLAAMDTKSIADHQAVIDEKMYWMKLRGEIFMKILERGGEFTSNKSLEWAASQTEIMFDYLYNQHKEFTNNG